MVPHEEAQEAAPQPPPRQPGIAFPPRRTPDGVRISSLPAEEQKKCGLVLERILDAPQPGLHVAMPAHGHMWSESF
jgi:hypothetical protein